MTTLSLGTKILVTSVMLLFVVIMVFSYFSEFDVKALAFAGFFALIAAMPWIDPKRPGRLGGLVALGFAAAFGHYCLVILSGSITLPRACGGKRLFCDAENFLFGIGGYPAASAPYLALVLLLAYVGIKAIRRYRREAREAPTP